MKYFNVILIIFLIFSYAGYPQDTKISLFKKNIEPDSQCVYTFQITPFKGDSIYKFEIYLIDTLTENPELISSKDINVKIRRNEIEVFFRDKFGNKRATIKFVYTIKENEGFSDNYLKIPVYENKRFLEGDIMLSKNKEYKFIFDNSRSIRKEFYLYKGDIFQK